MNKPKQSLWKRVKAEKVSYLMLLPNVILFTAFTVYPLLWVLRYMFFDYRGYGEPVFVGLENFARVMRDEVFWTAVKNTFVYVFGKLILTIPFAFLLALLLTGGQAANIFMISGFIRNVPKELDEAAYIDGAGTFRIFWTIIIPAIKPILGVVALFAFRTAWNEFVTAQVFTMSNPDLKTLSVAVANLRYSANAAAEWHIMTAGASIALIPILIVYLFANRQFITGLTAGAVKG